MCLHGAEFIQIERVGISTLRGLVFTAEGEIHAKNNFEQHERVCFGV